MAADLPWVGSKINYKKVQQKIRTISPQNVFLDCYTLQLKVLYNSVEGSDQIHPLLLLQLKSLTWRDAVMLSLTNWCLVLEAMPLSKGKKQIVFRHML